MKAILEFRLPNEKNEYLCSIYGSEFQSALWNIDQIIISLMNDFELPAAIEKEVLKIKQAIPDKLYEID